MLRTFGNKPMHALCLSSLSATNYRLIVSSNKKYQAYTPMWNSIYHIYVPLYPAFEETRCVLSDVGAVITARRGGGAKWRGGGPNDFLAGGPEIWSYATGVDATYKI